MTSIVKPVPKAIEATEIPDIALAVRQPWAWAIVYGLKDIENRVARAVTMGGMKPRRIAILASKGMGKEEYEDTASFMAGLGVIAPPPLELKRGGIIGAVTVTAIVSEHDSPWFFGPRGLVLADAAPCEFIPAVGQLGYFAWKPASNPEAAPVAPWMAAWGKPKPPSRTRDHIEDPRQQTLFG
jgi:hypothetical protein